MRYRPEIDGLRAFAVVPVVLYHAGVSIFGGGFAGVDVFFVISGYLITTIIWTEMDAGTFTLSRFYERRARRILPALFLVLVAILPFAWFVYLPSQMEFFSKSLVATIFFCSNVLFWQDAGNYFGTPTELNPLIHTWSLAIEEQYYLFFPMMLLLMQPFRRRWAYIVFAVVFVVSLGMAQGLVTAHQTAVFYLLPTRFWELLIGSFCAGVLLHTSAPPGGRTAAEILSGLGLVLIVASMVLFSKETPFPSFYTLVPTIGAALVVVFARSGTLAYSVLTQRLFVGVGLISYSLYLWHQPLFALARYQAHLRQPDWLIWILCLVSILLAYLSRRFVELPFRNRRQIRLGGLAAYGSVAAVVLISFGTIGMLTQGDLGRYTLAELDVLAKNAARGAYVWERKNALDHVPFASKAKTKVLVVGDSFSADLINAVYESGLKNDASITSISVTARCILFFSEQMAARIDKNKGDAECKKGYWFGNPQTQAILDQADVVLISGKWSSEDVDALPEDYDDLERVMGDKIYIVGTKAFDASISVLANIPEEDRNTYTQSPTADARKINQRLAGLFGRNFVDIIGLMCPGDKCAAFTPDRELISHDTYHLTQAGARYLGNLLRRQAPFSRFMTNS
ncbi:MAG: acyltransferase [Alphaproteobacteria bacterium]|nr:acyltransferase [Alphaproteobacteria bacterium]